MRQPLPKTKQTQSTKLRRALDEARRYVSELNDETVIFDDQDARQKAEGAKAIIEMFEAALSSA